MSSLYPFFAKHRLIAIGFSVIIVIGIILIFAKQPQKSKDNTKTNPQPTSIASQQSITSNTVSPTAQGNSGAHWAMYKGSTFQMQYPPDWVVQIYPTDSTNKLLVIRPSQLPQGLTYPQFNFQTETYTDQAIQTTEGILEGFKMQKSAYTVDQYPAIKYTGTIPYKIVEGNVVQQPIQDTTVLLHKGATLYVFKYEYEGDTPNDQLNSYFDDFIASFKTTQ